ncbi:hypothetical protein [Phenylobacterium sp.]|uniref:hypothetical protein n=1 Tax=Phenylobacterium sp. TaxID=1871053 RepID=UPI0027309093|nr:hypothetical protein [Phenylobacterium sp.]MDP1601439.1 hypothetical protein [Phenylobacterium sp.]MDP3592821.1 hypothetical protein [Phenylobacterium sp.]
MVRLPATILCLLSLAAPALAQTSSPAPAPSATAEDAWPWPLPDPKSWWDDKWPVAPEAADPLAGRRLGRSEPAIAIDNGYDPLLYRLWALPPLQNQILRNGEMILEVAVRPSTSARQSLIRVIVRRDGKTFVQARAGLGCCEPGIARRVGFDAELPAGSAAKFLALREDPLWDAPREVRVAEGSDAADALCIDGTSYDLTLVVPGKSRSVRRACDSAEVGQAADVLEAALGAALGHEPRFDVIYPTGASFESARAAYRQLTAEGGQLKPAPHSRPQPPTFQPSAAQEDAAPAP